MQALPGPADFVQCYKCTSVGRGNELDFPFVNIQNPSEGCAALVELNS